MIYSMRCMTNKQKEWSLLFKILFTQIHQFLPRSTSLQDMMLVSKEFRQIITPSVNVLTFLREIPSEMLQRIYTRHKTVNLKLIFLDFQSCSSLTDDMLQDILSSFSLEFVCIRECHSLTTRPPGAEILMIPEKLGSHPYIFVPGCWKMFFPHPSLYPHSVLEIQLCALETFEVDYNAAIKFNSFVAHHQVTNVWFFLENNGLLPVSQHTVMTNDELYEENDDEVTVTAYINLKKVSFDFKHNVHTKCWEMIDPFLR